MSYTFDGLVSLSPEVSAADIYVNGQTNVSAELITAIAEDSEKSDADPTGLNSIWLKVSTEASDQIKAEMLAEMGKRANFQEIAESSKQPQIFDDAEVLTASDQEMYGVRLILPSSKFQSFHIHGVYVIIQGDQPTDLQVRVFDVDSGLSLFERTVPYSDGYLKLDANITCNVFGKRKILIAVVFPDETKVQELDWYANVKYIDLDFVQAPEGEEVHNGLIHSINACFVGLDYELRLSPEKILIRFSDKLKRAFALKCASLIIDRGLKSKKASKYTQVNRDAERQNLDDIRAQYSKELANSCRLIYPILENEKMALVSRPDDQQGFFVGSFV